MRKFILLSVFSFVLSGCYLEASMRAQLSRDGASVLHLAEGPVWITYTQRDSKDCEWNESTETCHADALAVTDQKGQTATINNIDSACLHTYGSTEEEHYSFRECVGTGHLDDRILRVTAKFSERPLMYPYFLMSAGEVRDAAGLILVTK